MGVCIVRDTVTEDDLRGTKKDLRPLLMQALKEYDAREGMHMRIGGAVNAVLMLLLINLVFSWIASCPHLFCKLVFRESLLGWLLYALIVFVIGRHGRRVSIFQRLREKRHTWQNYIIPGYAAVRLARMYMPRQCMCSKQRNANG